MPRFVDYYCMYCERWTKDVRIPDGQEIKKHIRCQTCHHEAVRQFSPMQIKIDGYIPGNNGKQDLERGLDYYRKRYYAEDEQKKGVNKLANLSEV